MGTCLSAKIYGRMKSQTSLPARPIGPLETLRRTRGLLQGELARAAGVSASLISFAEAGYTPTPEVRARIAAALDAKELDLWPLRKDPPLSPWRKSRLKVEGQRQMLDTGPGRLLVVTSFGDPLHLSDEERGDPMLTIEDGEEVALNSRTWVWSKGRSRLTVKEYKGAAA